MLNTTSGTGRKGGELVWFSFEVSIRQGHTSGHYSQERSKIFGFIIKIYSHTQKFLQLTTGIAERKLNSLTLNFALSIPIIALQFIYLLIIFCNLFFIIYCTLQ